MRTGFTLFIVAIAASVLVHLVALLGVGLSARPKPLEAPPAETVTVDIVTPEEVAQAARPEPAKPELNLPDMAAMAHSAPSPPPPPAPPPQTGPTRQAAPVPARQAQARPPPSPPPDRSPFDPTTLAEMFQVSPVAPTRATPAVEAAVSGFDAPADKLADLAPADVAAFKAHLKKCLTLPAGVSAVDQLRVVLRIALTPDGALGAQPTLIEASASPNGPAMVQNVIAALRQCQPYSFLPADKYAEWKVLDLTFTPRDMAGG